MDIEVRDAVNPDLVVAKIVKVFSVGDLVSDASTYDSDFGKIQNPDWKVLLLSLALFVDFQSFQRNANQRRDNSVMGALLRANDGKTNYGAVA